MFTIGNLAAQAGISTDALRYYEREGLIVPSGKTDSGYRLYDKDSIRRVQFIRHAQHCGFTLAEIVELLVLQRRDAACCGDVRTIALEKKLQLESKIRTLKLMSNALDALIESCANESGPVDTCPILSALEQAALPERAH